MSFINRRFCLPVIAAARHRDRHTHLAFPFPPAESGESYMYIEPFRLGTTPLNFNFTPNSSHRYDTTRAYHNPHDTAYLFD